MEEMDADSLRGPSAGENTDASRDTELCDVLSAPASAQNPAPIQSQFEDRALRKTESSYHTEGQLKDFGQEDMVSLEFPVRSQSGSSEAICSSEDAPEAMIDAHFTVNEAAIAGTTPSNDDGDISDRLLKLLSATSSAIEQPEESLFYHEEDDAPPEFKSLFGEPASTDAANRRGSQAYMGDLDIDEDEASDFSPSDSSVIDIEAEYGSPSPGRNTEHNTSGTTTSLENPAPETKKLSLDELIILRDILLIKKTDSGLDAIENQKLKVLTELIPVRQTEMENEKAAELNSTTLFATSKPRQRRKPAKNAREFVARMHEKEREREEALAAKKKPLTRSARVRKTPAKIARQENELQKKRADLFRSLGDVEASVNLGTVPSMASFRARTHKDQFAKILESIPEGGDTRRIKSQNKDLQEAAKLFGSRKVKAKDGRWMIKGMTSKLSNYQMPAASWMVKRELAQSAPYGGLLADAMGLGKTVVTLACIVGNPPEGDDLENYSRATLVVVPNQTTARQWIHETQKHCNTELITAAQYIPSDVIPIGTFADNHTLVVTTYYEVTRQFPNSMILKDLKKAHGNDEETYSGELNQKTGDLFQVSWYRVVLDEAHEIKNKITAKCQACCQLSAKYHWALSGTPLANKKGEFYPYLKFIGCNFTKSYSAYKKIYVNGKNADSNFDALAALVMYRRTTNDTFLGCRILELPPSSSYDLWVSLSKEEEIIYRSVHAYYSRRVQLLNNQQEHGSDVQLDLCGTLRAGFFRLRQTVSHLFCLERLFRKRFRRSDISWTRQSLSVIPQKISLLEQMANNDLATGRLQPFSTGIEVLRDSNQAVMGGAFDLDHLLELIQNELEIRNIECPVCLENPIKEPMKAAYCDHIYCEKCLVKLAHSSHNKEKMGEEPIQCVGDRCEAPIGVGEDLRTLQRAYDDAKMDNDFEEPGRDSQNACIPRDADENSCNVVCHHKRMSIPPSAKLTAAVAIITSWLIESPDDKIIVFIEFLSSAKILGQMLEQLGIGFYYFLGGISQKRKIAAIEKFHEDPEANILITSLRSGGQSLNLTVANRVIITDPWWNKTLEAQAFGRVFRRGQQKHTHLVRIWSKSHIDHMIHDLQEKKIKIINKALQDDSHIPDLPDPAVLKQLFSPRLNP